MAAGGRFHIGTDDELAAILGEKDATNTKKLTKTAVNCFND